MRRFRWVRGVVVFGLAGVLVVPGGASAVPGRSRCRPIAFVGNAGSGTVSTIDVKTRAKDPTDIPVGSVPSWVVATPDGKTAFVPNAGSGTVSTIDVKTRAKDPTDIPVGSVPSVVAFTPDGNTALVTNGGSVSTIDVKTRTKNPTDIPVGPEPYLLAVTPDGKTVFVTNPDSGTVSTIDVNRMAQAQRTARPGPSKVAKNPSPVALISRPRKIMSSTTLSIRRPSTGAIGSDDPVPRGSNQMWRLNDDSPLRTNLGSSDIKSTGRKGLVANTSGGPVPTTW
jgi:YVTN family beta-propeller protein